MHQQIQSLSSKIDSKIDSILVPQLDSYRIKHAYTERGLPGTDCIIIPTFRERVRKCMEDNRDISTEIVRNDYEPYSVLFKAEGHSIIYNPNAIKSTDADAIVNNLRNTAKAVISDKEIMSDLADSREVRMKSNKGKREFARMLNNILHKTKFHMESRCSFITP
jgi:hypothetical protein